MLLFLHRNCFFQIDHLKPFLLFNKLVPKHIRHPKYLLLQDDEDACYTTFLLDITNQIGQIHPRAEFR